MHLLAAAATTPARLSADFVDGFFGGSAANLLMSLRGGRKVDAAELARLRALPAKAGTQPTRGEA